MEQIHDYMIASHRLRLRGEASDLVAMGLRGFAPFEVEAEGEALLTVDTACEDMPAEYDILTEFDFEEGQARCSFGRNADSWVLRIASATQPAHIFIYDRHTKSVRTNGGAVGCNPSFMRFGLWFVFNIATVQHMAAAVHSSVIVKDGRAVMFLGESGTGKSTHTRLWRETIAGATLLNDDSPFVGVEDGRAMVYGSPWSGKTPCYKAESYPLLAVVRLSQAPHNRIRPLKGVQAIGALLPSLPPAFAFDRELEEYTLATLSALLRGAKVYHLECLPNDEAARLSCETVFGDAD
ncbi:MAG: hypothetical protein J6P90_06535 [Rikenellaceae bacterium]|nr:hypothetical protein [Rikenellaceae bacterium]